MKRKRILLITVLAEGMVIRFDSNMNEDGEGLGKMYAEILLHSDLSYIAQLLRGKMIQNGCHHQSDRWKKRFVTFI